MSMVRPRNPRIKSEVYISCQQGVVDGTSYTPKFVSIFTKRLNTLVYSLLDTSFCPEHTSNMVYYDRSYFKLIKMMYGPRFLLFFFWIGSSQQFCTILKILYFNDDPEMVWKVQNKYCAMASVGVSCALLSLYIKRGLVLTAL
jgi:hypothetical protein